MSEGFRKAERSKARLRMGLAGPSGSGKTLSSLLIAYGITGDWSKIGVIDTENGSADLYTGIEVGGVKVGEYNVLTLTAPFTPERYIAGIRTGEKAGLSVIILDSLTHAWAGEGGILDQQGAWADREKNSYTAWRHVTPQHNALVEAMLTSSSHIIATMRAKTEYVLTTNDKGKTEPRKVGMAPIQRDGMEYEFTLMFDIDAQHNASTSKDRTRLFDGQFFRPTVEIGQKLLMWLEMGVEAEPAQSAQTEAQPPESKASAKTLKRLQEAAKAKSYTPDKMKEKMMTLFNVDASTKLTERQAEDLIAALEAV